MHVELLFLDSTCDGVDGGDGDKSDNDGNCGNNGNTSRDMGNSDNWKEGVDRSVCSMRNMLPFENCYYT